MLVWICFTRDVDEQVRDEAAILEMQVPRCARRPDGSGVAPWIGHHAASRHVVVERAVHVSAQPEVTYLEMLRAAPLPRIGNDRSVLLDVHSADTFVHALLVLREEFRRSQDVDRIGHEMKPEDAHALQDALRLTLRLPPKALGPLPEKRWRPDYRWAIQCIEQMLLMLGVSESDLQLSWPEMLYRSPFEEGLVRADRTPPQAFAIPDRDP